MEIFKPGKQYDFMGIRVYWISFSLIAVALSLVAIFVYPGPTYGTDFKGGTEVEVAFKKPVDAATVRSTVHKIGFASPDVVSVTDPTNPSRFLIRVQEVSALDEARMAQIREALCFTTASGAEPPADKCPQAVRATELKFSPGGDKIFTRYEVDPDLAGIQSRIAGVQGLELRAAAQNPQVVSQRDHRVEIQLKSKGDQLMDGLRRELGAETVPESALRVEWVGPKAGKQLRDAAIKSIAIAIVFIMAYVAFRFDMRFAPGGVVALVHDAMVVVGVFVFLRKEITLSTIAAVLTIVGYSINDTVVVYDRVRENLGKHRGKTFSQIINLSVSETLSRTILTSTTTLLSVLAFFIWGTGVIKDFALALLIGIIAGTYSSIYVAAPITEWIDRRFFGGAIAEGNTKPRAPRPPQGGPRGPVGGRKKAAAVV